jgi:hypothetical protein
MNFNCSHRLRTPSPHENFLHLQLNSPQGNSQRLGFPGGPLSQRHSYSIMLPGAKVFSPDSNSCNKFSVFPPAPFRPRNEPLHFIQPVQSLERVSNFEIPMRSSGITKMHHKAMSQCINVRQVREDTIVDERACETDFEYELKQREQLEKELQRRQREELDLLKSSVHEAIERKKDSASRHSSFPSFNLSSENIERYSTINHDKSNAASAGDDRLIGSQTVVINNNQNINSKAGLSAAETYRGIYDRPKRPSASLHDIDLQGTDRKLSFKEPSKLYHNRTNSLISPNDLIESKKIIATQSSEVSEAKSELMRKFKKNLQTLNAENEKLQKLIYLTNPGDSSRIESERELKFNRVDLEVRERISEGEEAYHVCSRCETNEVHIF